jgi:hypothetical protein
MRTYGEIDSFVRMLVAAREDSRMSKSLDMLLSAPDERRRAIVAALLERLRARGAPHGLIEAIACLLDDAVAAKAHEVIRGASDRVRPPE